MKLRPLLNRVVGLIAPGGVERWIQRSGGGGSQLEVVLEGVEGVGVVRGDGGRVRVRLLLHGHGAPTVRRRNNKYALVFFSRLSRSRISRESEVSCRFGTVLPARLRC